MRYSRELVRSRHDEIRLVPCVSLLDRGRGISLSLEPTSDIVMYYVRVCDRLKHLIVDHEANLKVSLSPFSPKHLESATCNQHHGNCCSWNDVRQADAADAMKILCLHNLFAARLVLTHAIRVRGNEKITRKG